MNRSTYDRLSTPQVSPDQQLYSYFLRGVEQETPEQLIQRFHDLFLRGSGGTEVSLTRTLDDILRSRALAQEFNHVLNRCCYILVNRWQVDRRLTWAIPELIDSLGQVPVSRSGSTYRSRGQQRLRELMHNFVQSEQYQSLHRLAQIVTESGATKANLTAEELQQQPLENLIRNYPYLYGHCLMTDDSTHEQQETIFRLRREQEKRYERDLSRYITYQVRLAQANKARTTGIGREVSPQLLQPVENPTLLDSRELAAAVRTFAGKTSNSATYRDVAQQFLTRTETARTYRQFKGDLYQYLTATVDPGYGKRVFNREIEDRLRNLFVDQDHAPLNELMITRTCSNLLGYMIVESPKNVEHYAFVDMLANLGPTSTSGLFLKLVLICRKAKPYLEKRFSILFNHYEAATRQSMAWFIQVLETMNVAFSIHFGSLVLPWSH
ncbi:MAG: hypothetical protein AAGF24_04590 [Cyanobacteria bacterium P01_H01_bin.121]